jgi:hypothetical protein
MILPGYKTNFETIKKACRSGDLALLECKLKETGATVIVLCAMQANGDGTVSPVPLAKMFDGNPYEELEDPTQGDG